MHTSEGIRQSAFEGITALGPTATPAVELLRELLQLGGEDRHYVVGALGAIGPAARAALPDLRRLAARSGWIVRWYAVGAAAAIEAGPTAVPLLLEALRDPYPAVSDLASRELMALGPLAAGAAPALVGHLRRSDHAIAASAVLSRIGPAAVPALLAVLEDSGGDLRAWSAWTLGGIAAGAEETVPALERRLRDPDDIVRAAAADALGCMGPAARAFLPAVERLALDPSITVRRRAEIAVKRLRADKAPVLPLREVPRLPPGFFCGNPLAEKAESFHRAVCQR